jgi:hypothetical protein
MFLPTLPVPGVCRVCGVEAVKTVRSLSRCHAHMEIPWPTGMRLAPQVFGQLPGKPVVQQPHPLFIKAKRKKR